VGELVAPVVGPGRAGGHHLPHRGEKGLAQALPERPIVDHLEIAVPILAFPSASQ
jgi:hypothetical protein